jgi:hypothetical protein
MVVFVFGPPQSAVSDCKNVIYDLLSSHGDLDNLVFFAGQMRDFGKVLQHHISRGNYTSGTFRFILFCSGTASFFAFPYSI